MKQKLNIVFMGTPDFAVPALQALHNSRHRVVGVVTQPDRPKGRGRRPAPPPVKREALALGYGVDQPEDIKSSVFISRLRALAPDLVVVVAFGQLLSRALLAVPIQGAINIHASLLPKYRGAAPIQWAIINREKETGVTIMMMDDGLDSGDIIMASKTEIASHETAESLHNRLSLLGAGLLGEVLDRFAGQRVTLTPQDRTAISYAPLLSKKDGHINWQQSAEDIEAFVRGMNPWPGAYTFLDRKRLKVYAVRILERPPGAAPGTVVDGPADELRIAAAKGLLSVLEIQGASGRKMPIKAYLRGNAVPVGTVFK